MLSAFIYKQMFESEIFCGNNRKEKLNEKLPIFLSFQPEIYNRKTLKRKSTKIMILIAH
jgi:hypothetical protein